MREALNLSEGEYLSDALEKGRATRVLPASSPYVA